MSTHIYIQNKSKDTIVELLDVDGVRLVGSIAPGQFLDIKAPKDKPLRPFIFREKAAPKAE